MDFILDRLAIGDLSDAKNGAMLAECGITAILNVAKEAQHDPDGNCIELIDLYDTQSE